MELIYLSREDVENLGMSMKVERSTLDQVRSRFDKNKRKNEEEQKNLVIIILLGPDCPISPSTESTPTPLDILYPHT